jgi:hypothetical protein
MERREFFKTLVAGGATAAERTEQRNRRAHHHDEIVYHGPMLIPERVAIIVAEHPAIKRTTNGGHLVSRYAEDGWTWLFRCQIPAHRKMVGEIVKTPAGAIRVHCWSAADPARYTRDDEPATIMARKVAPQPPAPIMPPLPDLDATESEWSDAANWKVA